MFDPKEYWKRRKAGKRGQDSDPDRKVTNLDGKNRRNHRRKNIARWYKDAKDKVGRKYTQTGVKHRDGRTPFVLPFDPALSNHTRHQKRKVQRSK